MASKPTISPDFQLVCGNCQRWRLRRDVFWHAEDACFYCQDVQACEYRYYIQGEREERVQEGQARGL